MATSERDLKRILITLREAASGVIRDPGCSIETARAMYRLAQQAGKAERLCK